MDLCEPPDEEEWEGSEALERKLLEMASQARYYLPAHTRLSRHLAAEIMGRVDCWAPKVVTPLRPWGGRSCMEPLRARRACADGRLQPSRMAVGWRVPCGGRDVWVAATPPTILPPRSIDPLTQVYCNALALYEDVTDKGRDSATKAKARGRAPTAPGPSPHLGAEVGMGLSSSVAMLNHRCDPNADWSLDASGGPAGPNVPPWQGPSSALAHPQGAPGGSGLLDAPRGRGRPSGHPATASGGSSDPPPQSPIPLPLTIQAASWSARCGPSAAGRSYASRTWRQA